MLLLIKVGVVDVLLRFGLFLLLRHLIDLILNYHVRVVVSMNDDVSLWVVTQIVKTELGIQLVLLSRVL